MGQMPLNKKVNSHAFFNEEISGLVLKHAYRRQQASLLTK